MCSHKNIYHKKDDIKKVIVITRKYTFKCFFSVYVEVYLWIFREILKGFNLHICTIKEL